MEEINEGVMDAFKAALKASGISDINPQDLGDNGLATLGKSGNPRFKSTLGASDGSDVMVYDIIMLYAAHAFRAGGGELAKSQAQYLKKVTKGLYTLWKKKDDKSMQQYYNWVDYLASQNAGRAAGAVSAGAKDIEAALVTAGEAGREAGRRDAEVVAGERMRAYIAEKYPEVWKELEAAKTPEEERAILKKYPEVAADIKKFGFGDSEAEAGEAEAGAEEAEEMVVHLYSKDPDGGETIRALFGKYGIDNTVAKEIIDAIAAQLKVNGITVKEGKEMDFLVSEVVALMEGGGRRRKKNKKNKKKKVTGNKNSRKNQKKKKAVSPEDQAARKRQSDRDKAAYAASRRGTKKKPDSTPAPASSNTKKRPDASTYETRPEHTYPVLDKELKKIRSNIQKGRDQKNTLSRIHKNIKASDLKGREQKKLMAQWKKLKKENENIGKAGDAGSQVAARKMIQRYGAPRKGRLQVGKLIDKSLEAAGYNKRKRQSLARVLTKALQSKAEKLNIKLTEDKINSLTEEALNMLLTKRVIERIDSDDML